MKFFILCGFVFFGLLYPFLSIKAFGQTGFEGIIRYELIQTGNSGKNVLAMLEYTLKGDKLVFSSINSSGNEKARILFIGNERTAYMIDDSQKTAIKIPLGDEDGENIGNVPEEFKEKYNKAKKQVDQVDRSARPHFIDTGEIEEINGYPCKKFRLDFGDNEKSPETFVWLTDEIKFTIPDISMIGQTPLLELLNETGFPLKLEDIKGNTITRMLATEIIRKKVDDEFFAIPDSYTISDLSSLMK